MRAYCQPNIIGKQTSQKCNYRSSGARNDRRIECVNIKAEMDRSVSVRVDGVEGHLDYLADPPFVHLVHAECFDS
jgi:hypothetical protein